MAKNGKKNGKKPNILVMWGDDIGQSNLSCFTKGMMGYRTPNIDRISHAGVCGPVSRDVQRISTAQKAASFTIDQVMDQLQQPMTGAG